MVPIPAGVGDYLQKLVHQVNRIHPDIEVLEVNTDVDHVHLLMSIPPKYSVSEVVNMVKANSGRKVREKFLHLDKVYWGVTGIWSTGYFVSNVGIHESTICNYVQMQGKEDSGQAELGL
jgi:putative transposase